MIFLDRAVRKMMKSSLVDVYLKIEVIGPSS